MIAIITGDIMNSRHLPDPQGWLSSLKKVLSDYGKSPQNWEIYRGDSFQIEIRQPENVLLAAIRIKAAIRPIKQLDVRIGIGIGSRGYKAPRITESNGEAFINSGEAFEVLKESKQTLVIKSPWPEIDKELNLIINLAAIAMDKWTASSAEFVSTALELNTPSQKILQRKLKIGQSSISERQTRAHYKEIVEVIDYFQLKIKQQIALL